MVKTQKLVCIEKAVVVGTRRYSWTFLYSVVEEWNWISEICTQGFPQIPVKQAVQPFTTGGLTGLCQTRLFWAEPPERQHTPTFQQHGGSGSWGQVRSVYHTGLALSGGSWRVEQCSPKDRLKRPAPCGWSSWGLGCLQPPVSHRRHEGLQGRQQAPGKEFLKIYYL